MKISALIEWQSSNSQIVLREIIETDLETLRTQKNLNRTFFFHQEEISEHQQKFWYTRYSVDPNNMMFMLEMNGDPVGCIGFHRHLTEMNVDFYNLMTWSTGRGSGIMQTAIQKLMDAQRELFPISSFGVDVLVDNPAITWYQKVGFRQVAELRHSSGLAYVRLEIACSPRSAED